MADFGKFISYFRSVRFRASGQNTQAGAPLPGSDEHGAYLADFAQRVQAAFTAIEQQTNSNISQEPQAPPNVQSIHVSADNGHFTFAITDQSEGLARGAQYHVEHADNPGFVNAQGISLGAYRNGHAFLGNATRFFRAYSSYPGSPASDHVYFGGQVSPASVSGGGSVPPAAFLPSQGSGTSAAGQMGTGPGPIQVRTRRGGFNWRDQRPAQDATGFSGTGTPAGAGALNSPGTPGGGMVTQGEIFGTHSQRLALNPLAYPASTFFYETDRTITYWVQDATGTVTVTGGVSVAWASGSKFNALWAPGTKITINSAVCTILTVNSPVSITLAASTANGIGVSYSLARGAWVYFDGRMENQWSALPNDLGANDAITVAGVLVSGFLFFDSKNSYHEWQWDGTAWTWGPDNDLQPGTIILRDAAPDPITGWHLADGTVNLTKYARDGTRTTVFTVPNMLEFYLKASGTYTGTGVAANPATILGQPLTTGASATGDNISSVPQDVKSGVGATVVGSVSFVPAAGDHSHSIPTLVNDIDGTPATFAVLPYYRL